MNEIDRLLEKIRRMPLLVGKKSLSSLVAFLNGYAYRAIKKEAKACEVLVLPGFQEFVARRYGDGKRHWSFVIEAHCISPEEAFDTFYELLDEFYSTADARQPYGEYKVPDVEVLLELNDTQKMRADAPYEGKKPFEYQIVSQHTISGIFRVSVESIGASFCPKSGILKGTIAFDSPEKHPKCLWIGKKVNVLDGVQIVGCATITDIFNPLLLIQDN